ncbi:hypothetical protein HPP92_020951 [Vanilla planifolia]|uniref:Uncharacterized protein n=1 Tax=Vanilla planifolia TaxID=51239 RepID=A0A835UIY9_VANPL|nr:hypothetical protein HPP92_020951 [Vanilla planifolia]
MANGDKDEDLACPAHGEGIVPVHNMAFGCCVDGNPNSQTKRPEMANTNAKAKHESRGLFGRAIPMTMAANTSWRLKVQRAFHASALFPA